MTWPIPNGKYINGSKLALIGQNSYRVNWWLIKNNAAKETTGTATFYPDRNATILHYKSYVHPTSIFAKLLKTIMVKSVSESLMAIKIHKEQLKKKNSPIVKTYIKKIEDALRGHLTYI